jgi:hypothetical protein
MCAYIFWSMHICVYAYNTCAHTCTRKHTLQESIRVYMHRYTRAQYMCPHTRTQTYGTGAYQRGGSKCVEVLLGKGKIRHRLAVLPSKWSVFNVCTLKCSHVEMLAHHILESTNILCVLVSVYIYRFYIYIYIYIYIYAHIYYTHTHTHKNTHTTRIEATSYMYVWHINTHATMKYMKYIWHISRIHTHTHICI